MNNGMLFIQRKKKLSEVLLHLLIIIIHYVRIRYMSALIQRRSIQRVKIDSKANRGQY